ncbi:MAG: hypothetical protein ACLRWF_09175 [Ruthenibacterium sp.]
MKKEKTILNRREAFARAIERDTKKKRRVAQRLAQAVRADEEKQAKGRRRAGAGRKTEQAPARRLGPGPKQPTPRTAGAGNEAQGAPRAN